MGRFMFDYKDPAELAPKSADLTPGEASFKVSAIFDSKKGGKPLTTMDGTPKLTLSLWVIDVDGNQGTVYDDLTVKTAWKIKALLDAVNLSHLYDPSGVFNPDELKDCVGRCVIELKKSEGYADRMSVKKYIKPKAHTAKVDTSAQLDELNDEIPY